MTTTRIDTAAVNAQHDLRTIAAQHSTLHRESTRELSGPCPHCGGTDRLHVTADSFFCRACYPLGNGQPHDAIAYMRWLHGCSFPEALTMLGNPMPTTTTPATPAPTRPGQTRPDAEFFATQPANLVRAQEALWAAPNPVREYLIDRGFTSETLIAWGIGYADNAQKRGPAVVIPWFRGGELFALHYRFLDGNKPKFTFALGSKPAGLLCGKHAFSPQPAQALFVVEGELNAMSIWQVARHAGIHVLSLGGETAAVTPAAEAFARSYPTRIVWLDREELARKKAAQLSAHAAWSLDLDQDGRTVKCDANELLQRWALAPLLARILHSAGAPAAAALLA